MYGFDNLTSYQFGVKDTYNDNGHTIYSKYINFSYHHLTSCIGFVSVLKWYYSKTLCSPDRNENQC
jgi:hypothetical protein